MAVSRSRRDGRVGATKSLHCRHLTGHPRAEQAAHAGRGSERARLKYKAPPRTVPFRPTAGYPDRVVSNLTCVALREASRCRALDRTRNRCAGVLMPHVTV